MHALLTQVLPDMLLAKAIMMTSPLVATLGLSLMIPFSVFADYMRGLARLSPQFFIGTFAVFVGFVLETMAEEDPNDGNAEEEGVTASTTDVEADGEGGGLGSVMGSARPSLAEEREEAATDERSLLTPGKPAGERARG